MWVGERDMKESFFFNHESVRDKERYYHGHGRREREREMLLKSLMFTLVVWNED